MLIFYIGPVVDWIPNYLLFDDSTVNAWASMIGKFLKWRCHHPSHDQSLKPPFNNLLYAYTSILLFHWSHCVHIETSSIHGGIYSS